MVQSFTGGEVGINISPDTTGFRSKLEAFLHSLDKDFTVGLDLDAGRFRSQVAAATRDRDMTVHLKTDGDWSALDKCVKQNEQLRKSIESKPLTYRADGSQFATELRRLTRDTDDFSKHAATMAKGVFGQPMSELDKLSVKTAEYRGDVQRLVKEQRDLATTEADRIARQNTVIEEQSAKMAKVRRALAGNERQSSATKARIDELTGSIETLTLRARKARQEEGKAGKALSAEIHKVEIPKLRAEVRKLKEEYKNLTREGRNLNRELTATEAAQKRTARNGEKSAKAYRDRQAELADAIRNTNARIADTAASMDKARGGMKEWEAQARAIDAAFAKAGDSITRAGANMGATIRDLDRNVRAHVGAIDAAGDAHRRFTEESRSLTATLDQQKSALKGMADAWAKAQPYGVADRDTARQLNDMLAKIDAFRKLAQRSPITASNLLDTTHWEEKYARVLAQAEELSRKLQQEHELDVRVRFWEDNADKVQDRLEKMRHERIDIPVDFQLEQESIARRMRDVAAQIKANPDRRAELEANLDVDMKRADEKVKEFERKHNELKMDLDLETALASAHMAYFTRPRTVDVYADFKGTDAGRLWSGMTSGATGIKGVQNQFDKLVNMFDSLDKVVPRVALIGTALTAVGAGATNLAATIGGVGDSILAMSKAAYAAPAALAGMAAAGYVGYNMFQDAKEKISNTTTALSGLKHELGESSWVEYGEKLKQVINSTSGTVRSGMNDIAHAEGQMVAGLADVVAKADTLGQLPAIFDNTTMAVRNLSPGIQDAASAVLSLGRTGGQYLPQFTGWVSRNMSWFAEWARSMETDSQRVDDAIGRVKEQAGYLADSFGSLKGILSGTFGTLSSYENGIQGFSQALESANKAVNSVSFQSTMRAWIDGARQAQEGMRDSFRQVGDAADILRNDVAAAMSSTGRALGDVTANVSKLLGGMGPGLRDFASGVGDGFSSMSRALAQASPMFSEFASMAGQLSHTFGGTFAATLKSVSPTLKAIAQVAEVVAKAFDALPDSIQGAIGVWATFGRMGRSALNTVKASMLQNVKGTLDYQRTMQELGLSADKASASIGTLVRAMARLNRGEVAGALSGQVKEIQRLGTAAEVSAAKVQAAGTTFQKAGKLYVPTQMKEATKELERTPTIIQSVGAKAKSAAGSLKAIGSTIVDALGGWQFLGINAAIGTAAAVWSSYQQHVATAQAAQESFNEAAKATPGALSQAANSVAELSDRMDNFQTTAKDQFDNAKFDVWDKAGLLGHAKTFDDMTSALNEYNQKSGKAKLNMTDLAKAAGGSQKDFEKLDQSLQKVIDDGTTKAFGLYGSSMTDAASAASALQQKLRAANEETRQSVVEKAAAVGKTAEYVDALAKEGQSWQSISEGLLTNEEKTQRLTTVKAQLASMMDSQRSAQIQLTAANTSYARTLDQVKSAVAQVNTLHEQGQRVWDEQAKDFDYTTEAGRTAADALSSLASSSNNVLESMIASGKSAAEVKKRQGELSGAFNRTATDAGVASGQVDALNQSLLMTPDEVEVQVSAKVLSDAASMTSLVDQVQFLFPDDSREQTRDLIVKSILSGQTDVEDLQKLVTGLADGKHTVVFDADGKPALVETDQLEQKARKLADGTYRLALTADDEASDKVQKLKADTEKFGGDAGDVHVLLEAKDDASRNIKDVEALAKALGMTPAEINMVANTDNASDKLDGIKAKLREFGLSDKEIDILFNAIDHASATAGSLLGTLKDPNFNGKTFTTTFMASGNAEERASALKATLADLGMTPDVIDWILSADGNADVKADKVREAMEAAGATPQAIEWLLQALDMASPTIDTVRQNLQNAKGDTSDLDILISAQDGASDKIKDATALAKAFGLTNAEIQILANDQASPELDAVKAHLRQSGLTDEQIQILIDALNKADPELDKTEQKSDKLNGKNVKFDIDADDTQATVKTATWEQKDGQTLATAKAKVEGDDSDAQSKFNTVKGFNGMMLAIAQALATGDNTDALSKFATVQGYMGLLLATALADVTGNIDDATGKFDTVKGWDQSTLANALAKVLGDNTDVQTKFGEVRFYDGMTLAQPWGRVLGDNSDARAKFQEVSWYDGATIAQPWGRVLGDNADAKSKFQEVAWYNGQTIARPWGRAMGDNSDARSKFQQVAWYDGMTLATPWGRVMGDDSNVQSVFSAVAGQDGKVLATTYVDVVTRKSEVTAKVATGGRISGPGTGTSDSIPAWLSNGEMVIKASSVKSLDAKYGPGFLNMLNSTGEIQPHPAREALRNRARSQAFAKGGRVTASDINIEVNPVVKVTTPEGKPVASTTTINQRFDTKVVRSDQDLYSAASIMYRNATREAGVFV